MIRQEAARELPLVPLCLVVVLLGVSFMSLRTIKFTSHARTSHADAWSEINDCFEGSGTLSPMFKMSNGRWSQYCDDGNNAHWRIFECGENREVVVVTQFKQALRRVKNYITNHKMIHEELSC